MSDYYNSQRTRNLYDPLKNNPAGGESFKLSRSKIDLFVECPRCFYLDRRLGVGRPPGFPFALNSAVDHLLKQEFDVHRAKGEQHPLQKEYSLDAIPAQHEELDVWRENFKGLQYLHEPTNLIITGAIDDLWINGAGEYIVVDYKSTAKEEAVTKLDKDWQDGYKRQMEIYQWLLRRLGYEVSSVGYFVYCTGKLDREAFDKKLEFEVNLISYEGNDDWIEGKIKEIYRCLNSENVPLASENCDYCAYRQAVEKVLK